MKPGLFSEPNTETVFTEKQSFFKQGAWLMITLMIGGAGMYAVHISAKTMPKEEYGLFTALLQVVNLMGIPALGLQTTLAQQTAIARSPEERRQLRGTVHGVMRGLFVVWLVMVLAVVLLRRPILESLKVVNPMGLWTTLLIALVSMWLPVFLGLLQGRQDFKWYGWIQILNGLGRFVMVSFVVVLLGGFAAGAMGGVLFGVVAALLMGIWHTRHEWKGGGETLAWRPWLSRVVPLTAGWAVGLYMLSADMIFVRKFFPEDQTGLYAAAGMVGRALVFFTLPLPVVLFPKVVSAGSRAESRRVLWLALGVTASIAVAGATFCTILPSLPLRIVYDPSFLSISYLVPWFVWAMAPLTLVNVLVNYLLAKECWPALIALLLIVAAYSVLLWFNHPTFLAVVRTLGIFNLLLVGVALAFVWMADDRTPSAAPRGA